MKRFDEMLQTANTPEVIKPNYKYFAYKSGVAIECASLAEAKETSKIYEKVFVNQAEVKASNNAAYDFRQQLEIQFFKDVQGLLIKEYPLVFDTDPSKWDAIFHKLKVEAQREFSSPDDIAERIDEIASMMQSILRLHFK